MKSEFWHRLPRLKNAIKQIAYTFVPPGCVVLLHNQNLPNRHRCLRKYFHSNSVIGCLFDQVRYNKRFLVLTWAASFYISADNLDVSNSYFGCSCLTCSNASNRRSCLSVYTKFIFCLD